MKSWKILQPGKLEQVTAPSEEPGEGCVKIKVNQTSLALPDFRIFSGKLATAFPLVPGRACAALVVGTGANVTGLARGNRVFVGSQHYCGACKACREGKPTSCESLKTFGLDTDGFVRDFAIVRASDCTPLPDRIKDSEAVFLDAVSLAVQVVLSLGAGKGEHFVISGTGVFGLILAQVALHYQTVPVLVDVNPSMFELAEQLGIYYTVNSTDCDPKSRIFQITGGHMAENVVHIASSSVPLGQSLAFAAHGGKVAIAERKGCANDLSCILDPICNNCISVMGINSSRYTSVAVNLLASKNISLEPLIGQEIGFDDVPQALSSACSQILSDYRIIVKI